MGGGLIGGLLGGILGGAAPKQSAAPQVIQQPEPVKDVKSATQIANEEEEDRRKRLLALNANGGNGQLTAAGGDSSMAPVSRKTLLGQ